MNTVNTEICPISHDAAKASPAWVTWRCIGIQHMPADETGPEENFELRNCPICDSTCAKEINK